MKGKKMDDSQRCVLCVDDEGNVLNSLKRLLRREPYKLLTALIGQEGVKILSENQVQVVISDQRMAEMSVPACAIPTQNTKLTMGQPQNTGFMLPHTPTPVRIK